MDKSDNDINVSLSLILRLEYKIVKLATLGVKDLITGCLIPSIT